MIFATKPTFSIDERRKIWSQLFALQALGRAAGFKQEKLSSTARSGLQRQIQRRFCYRKSVLSRIHEKVNRYPHSICNTYLLKSDNTEIGSRFACASIAIDVCCKIIYRIDSSWRRAKSASRILLRVASVLIIAVSSVLSFTVNLEESAPTFCSKVETFSTASSTFASAELEPDAVKTFWDTSVEATPISKLPTPWVKFTRNVFVGLSPVWIEIPVYVPSISFLPLKVVSSTISSISSVSWSISVFIALRSADPSVSLADCVTFSLMVIRMSLMFSRPPSAMDNTFLAVPILSTAVDRPRERANRRWDMTNPAGSSATSLMRSPVARFYCTFADCRAADLSAERALNAAIFVYILVKSPIAIRVVLYLRVLHSMVFR